MTIPCNYWINVAKLKTDYTGRVYYGFWCKIQLEETFEEKAIEKFETLKNMFGDEYKLDLEYTECYTHIISTNYEE